MFVGMRNLSDLDLPLNALTMLPSNAFNPLIALKVLDLSLNRIQRISPKAFTGLRQLLFLNLDNNRSNHICYFVDSIALCNILAGSFWICKIRHRSCVHVRSCSSMVMFLSLGIVISCWFSTGKMFRGNTLLIGYERAIFKSFHSQGESGFTLF